MYLPSTVIVASSLVVVVAKFGWEMQLTTVLLFKTDPMIVSVLLTSDPPRKKSNDVIPLALKNAVFSSL